MRMKWRYYYARYIHKKAGLTWQQAWYLSGVAVQERMNDNMTPQDAADCEISYWSEG